MSGRLSEADKDQLSNWIGSGPKEFTLLYAITSDGCNSATFHTKCDNQGPTVTVLYNQQGSVYGGYAGVSWNGASSNYFSTTNAFLYQLYYTGAAKRTKFPIKSSNRGNAIYSTSSYGPTFGSAKNINTYGNTKYDLNTFSNTIHDSGGYFSLNGSMNVGQTYDAQGCSVNQINNGSMVVTELEVYKVTDKKADGQADGKSSENVKSEISWRYSDEWNEQLLNKLKEEVVNFQPMSGLDLKEARILLIGPVGAGKSSFFNTISSAFRERITRTAASGSAEQSLTTAYTPYKVKTRSGSALNFRFCDSRGLEESQGLDSVECNYLLDGNIPDYYTFQSTNPITPKSQGFKTEPTIADMIHCVVFVLDGSALDVLPTKIVDKIKSFQALIVGKGIPQLILLTKIDKVAKDLTHDITTVFHNTDIEKLVDKTSELFGLPRADILPVKNYENETRVNDNTNILAFLALRRTLYYVEDFLDLLKDKMDDTKVDAEK